MPIDYQYDAIQQILTCEAVDPVAISDWLAVRDAIQHSDVIPWPLSRILLDLRQRRDFLKHDQIFTLITHLWHRSSIPVDHWIAVVASSDLGYGIGRMIQGHAEEYDQIQVFRELPLAREWLMLQPTAPPWGAASGKSPGCAGH